MIRDEWLFDTIIDSFANQNSLRTIALAYKEYDMNEFFEICEGNNFFEDEASKSELERGLTFVAAFGLQDDLRNQTSEAIGYALKGGINVRMCSGDHMATAKAVAIKSGILDASEADQEMVCMEAPLFR